VWSAASLFLVLVVARRLGDLRRLGVRAWFQLLAAPALISINWGVYIWAVTHGHVVDAAWLLSSTAFVTVALGVLVFASASGDGQLFALLLAVVAVVILSWRSGAAVRRGRLAASFALYGLVKRLVVADPG